jgi:steroid delta-isomerase-like uncharacterized protein
MSTQSDAFDRAVAGWNAGDLDQYLALYDERIQLHGYTPEPMGKAEVREFYDTTMSSLDNPQLEIHEVLWDGDACAVRLTMSGRHVGEFLGVPATGNEFAISTITILHFEGDKVVERHSQADMLGLLVQLGAVPAPA